MPDTDYYGYPSTQATGGFQHDSNPGGFTPMFIGDWHPPIDDGTGAPSGGGTGDGGNDGGDGPIDQGSKDPSQVIRDLGYDPGDPRNNLTTGFGSGRPTQRGVGGFFGALGTPFGVGGLTGPAASWITRMIQDWQGRRNVANALNPKSGSDTGGGGGPGTFRLPDFGNMFSGLPPGFTETNRFGGGAPIFTGPGAVGPGWAPGGSVYGGRANFGMNLPGSYAGLGSFSGADPLTGAWGGINSPVGRFALGGGQFDPAKTPSPGYQWGPGANVSGPGNMPIINWAAFGQGSSPGSSIHFLPKSQN